MALAPGSEGNKPFALGFSPPLGTGAVGMGGKVTQSPWKLAPGRDSAAGRGQ